MFVHLLLAVIPQTPHADATSYWKLDLAGHPVGFQSETRHTLPDGSIETITHSRVVMGRLGARIELDTDSDTLETSDGNLLSVSSRSRSSRTDITIRLKRAAHGWTSETTAGGKTYVADQPTTGQVLGPQGIRREMTLKLRSAGDRVSALTFVGPMGKIAKETVTLVSKDRDGRLNVKDEFEGMPGAGDEICTADGQLVSSSTDLPFGKLTAAPAQAQVTAMRFDSDLPTDSFEKTVAKANIRLPDPRSLERVKLLLTSDRPDIVWPNLDTPQQHVLWTKGSQLMLEVDRASIPHGRAVTDSKVGPQYRQPNALIQSDDALVKELSKRLSSGCTDPLQAAWREQRWVAARARFDGGVAVAPASETVRTFKGTCFAFAILLAALERDSGLASRVDVGYVYEQGMWGGHAWTEVRVGSRWIPIDAAVYSDGPADAARFSMGSSSMADGLSEAMAGATVLFGHVGVKVVEYQLKGKVVRVAATAKPYEVSADRYRNPWLGLEVRKPKGTTFYNLNAFYPDSTVVAYRDRKGNSVSVSVQSSGPSANVHPISKPGMAKRWIQKGQALWEIAATGPHAARSLRIAMSHMSIR